MLARQFDWLIVLLVVPAMTWAAENNAQNARRWLDRLAESNQRHSYHGTFIYRCDQQLTAMSLVHAAGDGSTREKLVALNGPEHVIVQDGHSISAVAPAGGRPLWARDRTPIGMFMASGAMASAIESYYTVSMVGEDRVAGRWVERVGLMPADALRNGFNLWVDKETGVVLRSDMLDGKGNVIEQVMFTDIEYVTPDVATRMVEDSRRAATPSPSARTQTALVSQDMPTPWRIATMPPGFALAERYMRPATEDAVAQEQWVLSDGLASVSVFFEPRNQGARKPFQGATRRGALNAMGSLIAGHQVTVMGEVPMATVKMISESLQYAPQ